MSISGMNHAVLYVRNADAHCTFYTEVLGFSTVAAEPGKYAFMRAPKSDNHHDIAFFSIGAQAGPSQAGGATVGLYHLAWEVPSLPELVAMRDTIQAAGALVGSSDHGTSKSLYCKDPDGLEFEVMWRVPAELWGEAEHQAVILPLDLDADLEKYAELIESAS